MELITNDSGQRVVILPEVIFTNKQNINWDEVELYLKKYVGMIVEVADTKDIVYIGNEFPNEFSGSKYTYSLKGSRAKAKANTVQGICEMIEIATDRRFRRNLKKTFYGCSTRMVLLYYTICTSGL